MAKYAIRPKAAECDDGFWVIESEPATTIQVWEPEKKEIPTGLIDQNGNAIYRVPDKIRVGFC